MLKRLVHLQCDCCGSPAEVGDTLDEARNNARAEGWLVRDSGRTPAQRRDLCARCKVPDHDATIYCLPESMRVFR